MRYAWKIAIIVALLAGGLALWGLSGLPAAAGTSTAASPSPSPSPSVEPTATPVPAAPARVVKHALRARRAAVREWHEWNRARGYFAQRVVLFHKSSARRPDRSESRTRWVEAARQWCIDAREYKGRTTLLLKKMVSTKGGGALRWRPLIRYWWPEWSESQVYLMAHIVWHESSGSAFVWNNGGSGAFGLFQLLPKPAGVWGPMSQAQAARWKYDHGGLAHWAGCAAFSCSGGCGIH